VAGGTGRKDDTFGRETLAERVANTRARDPDEAAGARTAAGPPAHDTSGFHPARPTSPPASWAAPPALPPTPSSPPPPIRHCWYLNPDLGRLPALLLKWRHTGDRHFDGFICTVALDSDGGYALVEMWVDAALLAPA
jgi:hypothetical protein